MGVGHSNTRDWSDEDLRAAVASQYTWQAVAKQLGLAPGSTNSVRRHVHRLGLNTSHFEQSRRTWSDDELRSAVAVSTTWTDVMRELGLSETGAGRGRVIARARELGLEVNRQVGSGLQSIASAEVCSVNPDLGRLGSAAERIAAAWFELRGIAVSAPIGPQAYDLLAALPDGVKRVQVKSTTYRGESGTWQVGVGRRPYVYGKSVQRLPYAPDELDFYFIADGDGLLYLIPSSVLGGRTYVNIGAYSAYRVGDASSLLAEAA